MNVTCKKCGWVHFAVTRAYAEAEVARFNEFYDGLPREQQLDYYGGKKSDVRQYEHCMCCGQKCTGFQTSGPNDCPDGCTLNPIISELPGARD